MAVTLFKNIGNVDDIGEFLRGNNSLMLGLNLVQAQQRLKQMLEQSLTSVKKALKDWGHKLNKSEPNSLEILQKNKLVAPGMHLQDSGASSSTPPKQSKQTPNFLTQQPKLPLPSNSTASHVMRIPNYSILDENGVIRDCLDLDLPYNLH